MLINKEIAKEKKWLVKNDGIADRSKIREMSTKLGINPIVAALLFNRGYTDAAQGASFIRMESEILRNPFDMKDMDKATSRINRAIRSGERITVYGDYDVDGVTSVCTLYLYLKSRGGIVDYYIPNRTGEGYGVSCQAIDAIKDGGSSLIITVDTGITANEEVEYAKGIGVDFLITDHHECRSELPAASAVINPHRPDCNYPFKELAGVGVVFKLICAYEERYLGKSRAAAAGELIRTYADLVAIGTIADVMPIKEENRIIVKYGLGMIENTSRVGLSALMEASGGKSESRRGDKYSRRKKKTKITSGYIGFTLAPRINAAGRVRSASMAVELFLSESMKEALAIAEALCAANKERQSEENKIMLEAYQKIDEMDIDSNPVIVLDADEWHHGVIGIVSSRITEKYGRPSILVSFEGNSDEVDAKDAVGKGSGRSIKGLNLVDALCYCSEYLVKFGGHELAAGLSVTRENLPMFRQKINEFARKNLSEKDMIPVIEADMEIRFQDINLALAEALQLLEPYGVGNPIPLFVMRGVGVMELGGVSDGKHTKITFTDGRSHLGGIYFSNSPDSLGVRVGDKVDILFSIDINEWLDRKSVQLVLRDIKLSGGAPSMKKLERERFMQIRGGDFFSIDEDVLPDRADFVSVYRFIQNSLHTGVNTYTHSDLCTKISSSGEVKMNYIKLKFIMMIFREMNLIDIDEYEDECYRFNIHYSTTKRNLEKSSILRKLRSQMR
ncbi:MAG: single-stranded-DNA-specific exonuclease RecJ [Clostridia bacterium]|nr:single-stranded-DNA-specific exonuclease RecJ [Clostridia bacterium]